ncbi:peptide-methionine (S)-S-oxide reductase MsrA [Sphingomonas sp.]|uniref:peptide-methionine (S)-S-oxide reductase MsrA n=1 Tax=Sphingomonas sp. TaxID=28214 RepID=UPI001D2E28F9|nr:peptide-methionine (S)-S-oxide reductase MsrA [Sphingomonas sp.]MBX9795984.1 peptide-methionine (S)-S-oxide reductase MsrA [Sphingomonas sp.]
MNKFFVATGAAGLLSLGIAGSLPAQAEKAVPIPPPARDVPARGGTQTAVFAGGCFWGMEAVFEQLKGVRSVTSGYAGGSAADANYEAVSSETTRHAEAVQIVYDPAVISYGTLLRVFFSVAHDPTQLNRQGPDSGPSYRSAIFPRDAQQRAVAAAYIAQLAKARSFAAPIVTRIESGNFYPAEGYHQDFFARNPAHPYIVHWDKPKVAAFRAAFAAIAK